MLGAAPARRLLPCVFPGRASAIGRAVWVSRRLGVPGAGGAGARLYGAWRAISECLVW